MAQQRKALSSSGAPEQEAVAARAAQLESPEPVVGVPGPGRWLVAEYQPTALFSLKMSLATSSVGKTLVIPTPYAVKMAFVDAAFRAGLSDAECGDLLESLINVDIRVAPSPRTVVTHTFVKIRQEPHGGSRPDLPYIPNIAYREVAYCHGLWQWAFDLACGDEGLTQRRVLLAPHVSYVGKRGSFVQFSGLRRIRTLDPGFTQPTDRDTWQLPARHHVVPLDDFGPEASLDVLSSYSQKRASRDRHRRFVHTVVPVGLTNTGPGFSEYSAG